MDKKLGGYDAEKGLVAIHSQYTGERVIEYQTTPDNTIPSYYALEEAVRNAEAIAYAEAKRVIGEKIVKNLLD